MYEIGIVHIADALKLVHFQHLGEPIKAHQMDNTCLHGHR